MVRLSVGSIANPGVLRRIWRNSLNTIWSLKFNDLVLWHDPIDHLQFAIDPLSPARRLIESLTSGQYRPQAPFVVRAAKSRGLTRPVAVPHFEDELVYRAIVEAAAASLLRDTPPYAHFGRSQPLKPEFSQGSDYETWFETFLRRQGALRVLADKGPIVVESDVSSFFVYINHDRLRGIVTQRSILDHDVVALLGEILSAFVPRAGYSTPGPQGLIQGDYDASRILAHVYLDLLDATFKDEGQQGRYVRWVDDIVLSVDSEDDALDVIRRIQLSLEPIGLAAHPSKTRAITKAVWEAEHYPEFNDYLDGVEQILKTGLPANAQQFLGRFKSFLRAPKKRYRPRIMRRFFTVAKAAGFQVLRPYTEQVIREAPNVTRWVLNYLSTFPLTLAGVERAFRLMRVLGRVYEDVRILLLEYLLMAPNKNRKALRHRITELAKEDLADALELGTPMGAYVAGLLSLVIFKFGYESDLASVRKSYQERLPLFDDFSKQALVCLGATLTHRDFAAQSVSGIDDPSLVRLMSGLRALEAADAKQWPTIRRYLKVIKKKRPNRRVFRPRALPCLFYAARGKAKQEEFVQFISQTVTEMRHGPDLYRDGRAIALLRDARRQASAG